MATPRTVDELFDVVPVRDPVVLERLRAYAEDVAWPNLMTEEEMEGQEPPRWYLEKFLQQQSLTIMYGPPKTGKTFLALEWAHCLALGEPWLTEYTAIPTRVLYCAAEGTQTLGERTKALRAARGWPVPPANRLLYLPGVRTLFFDRNLRQEPLLELYRAIDRFEPHVVVIDTLARHTPGADVSANSDMSRVVGALDEMREGFGCSFLVVHHTRKDKSDYLGATALFGAADAMVEIRPSYPDGKGFSVHVLAKELEEFTPPHTFYVKSVDPTRNGWGVLDIRDPGVTGPQQQMMLEFIRENEGLRPSEIQRAFYGEAGTGAEKLLAKMRKAGLVVSQEGRYYEA